MRAYAVGFVEASRNPDFADGEAVTGLFGVQQYAISNGKGVVKADPDRAPLEAWVGGLGMPGWTAYFGLLHVGEAKEGDTVVVSAASGAVGSVVGQIAKIKGCRAVGIAGGPDKCAYIVDELGFDAAIDYKSENLHQALKTHCPDGVDVYFENVGGDITDAVLSRMNTFGRVPVCGLIAYYNATEAPPGLKNVRSILVNRLKMQGFIVFDFVKHMPEAMKALGEWYGEGRIKLRQDVREGGVDAYPDVLNELYTGGNFGKLVLKL
jgi:NADPH-dependent curcumin reductase CurA